MCSIRDNVRPLPCAVVTDPPYGDTSLKWDRQVSGWLECLHSAVPRSSSLWCFGSMRFHMSMASEFAHCEWKYVQEIIWEKQNGSGFHADRFKRVHEIVIQFYRDEWASVYKAPVTTPDATARTVRRKQRPTHMGHIEAGSYASEDGGPRLMRSVIKVRNCHGSADHPTQKPIGIIDPLLRYSVPAGGTVLDPFAGSGSTLVAAKALGMNAIGIEIDEACCEVMARRLSQEVFEFQSVAV